eukprot:2397513-Alexandrium_andersonii.AAC.1
MEDEDMSDETKESIQAEAVAASRAGFPGIPVKPTEEYGAVKHVCRDVVLKFCELTALLLGGNVEAMHQACERARHEGDE